jgi:hypothetical protein
MILFFWLISVRQARNFGKKSLFYPPILFFLRFWAFLGKESSITPQNLLQKTYIALVSRVRAQSQAQEGPRGGRKKTEKKQPTLSPTYLLFGQNLKTKHRLLGGVLNFPCHEKSKNIIKKLDKNYIGCFVKKTLSPLPLPLSAFCRKFLT